jgi:hypothetical protein
MNVVRLCGGLGNQFYQYAFGKTLESIGLQVSYNIDWYEKPQETPRDFNLEKFDVKLKYSPFLRIKNTQEPSFSIAVNKEGVNAALRQDANYRGYWQHPKYYSGVLESVKKEFVLKKEYYTPLFLDWLGLIESSDSISLHVRHGDYVTKNSCYVQPLSYYYEALQYVQGNIFIFSDDIEWCKVKFNPQYFSRNIYFIDLPDYLSFELMKRCKSKIIANSTFSYWAALLNNNDKDIVIAPKNWRIKEDKLTGIGHDFPKHWRAL